MEVHYKNYVDLHGYCGHFFKKEDASISVVYSKENISINFQEDNRNKFCAFESIN